MNAEQNFEQTYFSLNALLEDLREGTLKEQFLISSEVWSKLVTQINFDPSLAKEIVDNGVLLLLATSSRSEIEGVLEMAEVCSRVKCLIPS
jgi:type II secretory pathway component PulK